MSDVLNALKRMTYGVYVIGAKVGEKINGMTAAWVAQVSSEPPMVMVAVGKTHYTRELIEKSGFFSINILASDQHELVRKCGFTSGRDTDKLAGEELTYKVTGAPILPNSAAYLDCKVVERYEIGDHVIFVGEVVAGEDNSKPAMVYNPGLETSS